MLRSYLTNVDLVSGEDIVPPVGRGTPSRLDTEDALALEHILKQMLIYLVEAEGKSGDEIGEQVKLRSTDFVRRVCVTAHTGSHRNVLEAIVLEEVIFGNRVSASLKIRKNSQ